MMLLTVSVLMNSTDIINCGDTLTIESSNINRYDRYYDDIIYVDNDVQSIIIHTCFDDLCSDNKILPIIYDLSNYYYSGYMYLQINEPIQSHVRYIITTTCKNIHSGSNNNIHQERLYKKHRLIGIIAVGTLITVSIMAVILVQCILNKGSNPMELHRHEGEVGINIDEARIEEICNHIQNNIELFAQEGKKNNIQNNNNNDDNQEPSIQLPNQPC